MKKSLFLFLGCCMLCLSFRSESYSAFLLDRVVAVVNNEIITWSELDSAVQAETGEMIKGLEGEAREEKIKEMSRRVLNDMITVKLQLQEARAEGMDAGVSEIEGAITDIKKKYDLTDEAFAESLRTEGLTLEEYKERLREQILLSKVVRRNIHDTIVIDDKEITGYYEGHKDRFRGKEQVRLRQIFLSRPENGPPGNFTEALAAEIMKRLQKGEDFAKMAQEFSEDPGKDFGGDLGYISRGSVLKEVEEEAFRLSPGQISKPFWSSSGLHIIKVEDRKEGVTAEGTRKVIQDILYRQEFESRYSDWTSTLKQRSHIEIFL